MPSLGQTHTTYTEKSGKWVSKHMILPKKYKAICNYPYFFSVIPTKGIDQEPIKFKELLIVPRNYNLPRPVNTKTGFISLVVLAL